MIPPENASLAQPTVSRHPLQVSCCVKLFLTEQKTKQTSDVREQRSGRKRGLAAVRGAGLPVPPPPVARHPRQQRGGARRPDRGLPRSQRSAAASGWGLSSAGTGLRLRGCPRGDKGQARLPSWKTGDTATADAGLQLLRVVLKTRGCFYPRRVCCVYLQGTHRLQALGRRALLLARWARWPCGTSAAAGSG